MNPRGEIRRLMKKYAPDYKVRIVDHSQIPVEKALMNVLEICMFMEATKKIKKTETADPSIYNGLELLSVIYNNLKNEGFTWGMADTKNKIIYINKEALLTDQWKETTLHEIAHALVPDDDGHGDRWRSKFEELKKNEVVKE